MIDTLKQLLGLGPKVDMAELIASGAIIIDVRSGTEFAGGHLKKSVNVPLNTLTSYLPKLKKNVPVITCCASGMRSSSAQSILQANGFTAYNGGSWHNLKKFEN